MEKVKVAIIGCGFLGKWHLEKAMNLAYSDVIAAVEPSEETRKNIQAKYVDLRTVSDIDEVMDEIEAGVVVTPTSHHFEMVKRLLEAGKHVFCEKPLTSNINEAKQLKQMLNEKKIGRSNRA